MFRVKIDDMESLLKLCSVSSVDYIDVYLNGKSASFVANNTEIFCCFTAKLTGENKPLSFRLKRVYLQQLTVEGSLLFEETSNNIIMSIVTDAQKLLYSVIFKKQIVFNALYEHKLQLIAELNKSQTYNIAQFKLFTKVARATNSIICIDRGVAALNISGNNMVYIKTDIDTSFAITAYALSFLNRISSEIFLVENYVGVTKGNLFALATKTRSNQNDMITYAEESGAKCKCSLNLGSVLHIATKLKVNVEKYTINLNEGICQITFGDDAINVPVDVTGMQTNKPNDDLYITFTQDLIKTVIYYCEDLNFQLSFKKGFILLENERLSIIM